MANTRMAIMDAKKSPFCHSGRLTSGTGTCACAAAFAASSFRKTRCISSPITMLNATAPTARATPSSMPSTRAVRMIARTLMAGPE